MVEKIEKSLIELAKKLEKPLYMVGGAVRNFLIDKNLNTDFDLASANTLDEMVNMLNKNGFIIEAIYKRTNTIKFKSKNGISYEYTTFRTEKYIGGEHTPYEVSYTDDIILDAKRRDFKCNAVYYDIKNLKFVDPLNGIDDIKNKIISSADEPRKVFCFDGLRLMRLVRFSVELNFKIDEKTFEGATEFKNNILEISPERIFEELNKILVSDKKYSFSNKLGHYEGLKLLHKMGVLELILKDLCKGENMPQRADFHKYDVLEHSFRTVLYADSSIRLAGLFHDIGKPYAMLNYGKYASHPDDGEKIAYEILTHFKASKNTIKEICFLVKNHMVDLELNMKENKVKYFIVKNYDMIDKLMLVKQADYSACKDNTDIAPTVKKWKDILQKMKEENVPFSLKELNVSGKELEIIGYRGKEISKELDELLRLCINNPKLNNKEKLLTIAGRKIN